MKKIIGECFIDQAYLTFWLCILVYFAYVGLAYSDQFSIAEL